MKKFSAIAGAVILAALTLGVSAAVPDAWFELGYQDGAPVDLKENLEVEIQEGEVVDTTVTYEGTEYNVTAFVGNEDQEGMIVNLPFGSEEEYGEWLLSGCTFELFIELEDLANGTSGFFSCVNGGGSSLYYRNGGDGLKQIQFQIGTTDNSDATNAWGSYAGAAAGSASNGPVWVEAGKLIHCVGTYNKETNMLSVYYNGELASEGSYGSGEFKLGSGFEDCLGIGINPAYPSESYSVDGAEFRVVGAKLYNVALTAEEVAEEYAASIKSVTGIDLTAAEEVAEEVVEVVEEAPVEEEVVEVVEEVAEEVVVEEEEVVEEVVVEEETTEEVVETVAAPQTFDFGVIAAVSALVSAIGYAISKKH